MQQQVYFPNLKEWSIKMRFSSHTTENIYKLQRTAVKLCLYTIRKICHSKDNGIANLIHETAALYDTRPQDGWKPPPDWEY
jgi:hypothetical protein